MRTDGPLSDKVEDRRGQGRGFGGQRMVGGGIGVIVIALIALFFGVEPRLVPGLLGDAGAPTARRAPSLPTRSP